MLLQLVVSPSKKITLGTMGIRGNGAGACSAIDAHSEEQVEVHMVLKLFKLHLDVVTQFVHLEYIDVYQENV